MGREGWGWEGSLRWRWKGDKYGMGWRWEKDIEGLRWEGDGDGDGWR